MNLRRCLNFSEDGFPLPAPIRDFYGPFGFPDPPPGRPYITSNFVIALDGRASFREIKGRAGGQEISRSAEDRWLMDFLRAHHDAQLMGAATMREEPGGDPKGWDYGIDDQALSSYRRDVLKLGPPKVIILTGGQHIDFSLNLFHSPRVQPWILTTRQGADLVRASLRAARPSPSVEIIPAGNGPGVDLPLAVRILRLQFGIRTLLCEGGPSVYSELLRHTLIDEDFRTIAFQVPGHSTIPAMDRPTPYGNLSFTPETAPWFRLISLHYALPYHAFLRLRYEGPRNLA